MASQHVLMNSNLRKQHGRAKCGPRAEPANCTSMLFRSLIPLSNWVTNYRHQNQGRTNRRKHRKNLSGSYHKGYSHTYNSGIMLSRLQRIYHALKATYYPLK